ncbi:MAG: hypothetical protein Q9226_001808 [Calogaya cf. arnoldii]
MAYSEGVDPYKPEVRKEFKTSSASSAQPAGQAIDLPRKYIVGDLPAEEGRSIITNDVSSFRTIVTAASVVYDMCGKPLKSPGWATVGQRDGMAVALWGTGSTIDKKYPNLRTIIELPSLPRPVALKETA